MGNLDNISRMTYLADMSILYEKILKLEEKVDYLMDKVSKYEVEQLDQARDTKPKSAETNKINKTKKKIK